MCKLFKKGYADISESDLNEFTSGMCERMMMFEGDFPNFLPYLIREVVNHPQINSIDKDQLESYCDMFDLRWRDDPEKPLLTSPVYTQDSRKLESDMDKVSASEKMRKACIPYIEELKNKMMNSQ